MRIMLLNRKLFSWRVLHEAHGRAAPETVKEKLVRVVQLATGPTHIFCNFLVWASPG